MNDIKLGQLASENALRDAVHVAIAPVVAGEELKPGWHVGLNDDGEAVAVGIARVPALGVVDPFLKCVVVKGQRFWLCLYQQTVTGMRHCWSHPAFGEEPAYQDRKGVSFTWLAEFCAEHGVSFGELIEGVSAFVKSTEDWAPRYVQPGSSSLRDNRAATPEFWAHFTAYTGITVPPDKIKENPFCCSC